MTDVMFLLETMFTKEEGTVKQILDCLYDVASVNLINQRVRRRSFNRIAKWAARFSKPIFRVIALRWFKRNCPRLITDWLYTQVKFEPQKAAQVVEVAESDMSDESKGAKLAQIADKSTVQPFPAADLELYRQEVRDLHSRVKLLTTLLIGVTVTLGSGLAWSLARGDQMRSSQQTIPATELAGKVDCSMPLLQPCP